MHWTTSTFHPPLLLPEVYLVPLSLLLVPAGFLVSWVLLPLMVLLSPLRAWWWRALLPCLGSPGLWALPLWEGKVLGRAGVMDVSFAAKDQDWGSTVSLVLPPLCVPIYTHLDVQVCEIIWYHDEWVRGSFVELWCFTDCRLKGRQTEHLVPPWCWHLLFIILILTVSFEAQIKKFGEV